MKTKFYAMIAALLTIVSAAGASRVQAESSGAFEPKLDTETS